MVTQKITAKHFSGCPGSKEMTFKENETEEDESGRRQSHLQQWPIQLHLVSPFASVLSGILIYCSLQIVLHLPMQIFTKTF